jgi:hypothetical protein
VSTRRRYIWALAAVVAGLFVSGMVWRATHPNGSEAPVDETDVAARQDGYYLCLHRRPMTAAEMYRLVRRRLPNDDLALALRGCQEAQQR